jgi:hypothetical protein
MYTYLEPLLRVVWLWHQYVWGAVRQSACLVELILKVQRNLQPMSQDTHLATLELELDLSCLATGDRIRDYRECPG